MGVDILLTLLTDRWLSRPSQGDPVGVKETEMLKRGFRTIVSELSLRALNQRKPQLDPGFLQLLNSLIEWKVNAELCRREAGQDGIGANGFSAPNTQDDGVAK
jgi:hypothetical protein